MIKPTIDIYAHTNPAFTAIIFHEFTKAFCDIQSQRVIEVGGASYPIFFIAYPILYTIKGYNSFKGTNRKTGLYSWLERNPEIRIDFSIEAKSGKPYVKKALLFAVSFKLLKTDGWYYWSTDKPPLKKITWKVKSDERGQMVSNARSLGSWFAKVDSPTLFKSLGVRP